MDNFIVSALKYRPASFDMVVGQESITTTLKSAIKNNHLSQAYLFCGSRGIGKTTCARILAKTINCKNITSNIEACNVCESCLAFNESRSYNIHELDAASNNSVEDIRNLTDQVRILPQIGKFSIYIIDEVHMLSASAFNAFLKTLEEPPAHAIFILATTQKHKIIPTILSRCQIFNFNRIKVNDIVKHLEYVARNENINFEVDALNVIAQKSDGAMRDALFIFDQIVSYSGNNITYKNIIENLNILDYEYYFKLTNAFLESNISDALLIFNDVLNNGFDAHNFITGLSEHIRNLLVCKDDVTVQLLEVGENIRERYKEQTSRCPLEFLFKALSINNDCDINYKASNNKRLHVELNLIQLCNIISKNKINNKIEKENFPAVNLTTTNVEEASRLEEKSRSSTTFSKNTTKNKISVPYKSSTPSIKNALKSSSRKLKNLEKNKEILNVHDRDENSENENIISNFTQDDLLEKWTEFANTIKEKQPRLYSTFTSQSPILKEDFTVEFKINNPLQQEAINGIKNQLLNFLKGELKNHKIQLLTIISKKKSNNKPYTPEEKFNLMNQKNPNLDKLKQQFNLDFE